MAEATESDALVAAADPGSLPEAVGPSAFADTEADEPDAAPDAAIDDVEPDSGAPSPEDAASQEDAAEPEDLPIDAPPVEDAPEPPPEDVAPIEDVAEPPVDVAPPPEDVAPIEDAAEPVEDTAPIEDVAEPPAPDLGPPPPPPPPVVVINEVACHGGWIELVNTTADELDLSTWSVAVTGVAQPLSLILPAGGFGAAPIAATCGADTLQVLRPDGAVSDVATPPAVKSTASAGRLPDVAGEWATCLPTPNAPNAPAPPPVILVNEVGCEKGGWVELLNPTPDDEDLTGWSLHAGGTAYPFEGAIPAQGFRLVAPAPCGVDVELRRADGGLSDAATPPVPEDEESVGRLPDGAGAWIPCTPTPSAPNAALPPPVVQLNELACHGAGWVELRNASPKRAVDLAGWSLAVGDVVAPIEGIVPAGGFTLVQPGTLSCGVPVQLLRADGSLSDAATPQGVITVATSGRLPDGTGPFTACAPTPGAPNAVLPPPVVLLNEVDCRGSGWAELVNPSADREVDLTGWTVTVAGASAAVAPIALPPGGFAIVDLGAVACGIDAIQVVRDDGSLSDDAVPPRFVQAATAGRLPDATGEWQATDPTPAAPNAALSDPMGWLFDPLHIVTIDLTLGDAAAAALGKDPYTYVDGTFQLTSDGVSTDPLAVGVRLKGKLGSYRKLDQKAAFKVKLNYVDKKTRFAGLKKLTLNNMVQDTSMTHEVIAYRTFREAGVHAPRVGYAWVRVNGKDYGVYANIEPLDDVFLDRRFTSTKHLYEGAYWCDLVPGNEPKFEIDEGDTLDTNDLTELIDAVNTPPGDAWFETVDAVADLGQMAREWATELYLGHWDGYVEKIYNNYYLHDGDDERFVMMPWGTDQTFNSHLSFTGGTAKLFTRCMLDTACYALYVDAFGVLLAAVDAAGLEPQIVAVSTFLAPYVAADPRKAYSAASVQKAVDKMRAFLVSRRVEAQAWFACASAPDTDGDGDGATCASDCDDANPARFPDNPEVCGDAIDQDCSGTADDDLDCDDFTEAIIGGHRYLLGSMGRTWDEARAHCQAFGSDLAILDTAAEQATVGAALPSMLSLGPWIGLTDLATEGQMTWVDGTPAVWTRFVSPQPDNWGKGEDCVHLFASGDWNDNTCASKHGVLCEDPCPAAVDGDGDGLGPCQGDCDDANAGVYPGAVDTCGDGVDDDCNGKTDDGLVCQAACTDLERGGRRYLFCSGALTFAGAASACASQGSALVALEDLAENTWVWSTAQAKKTGAELWIGLTDAASEGVYTWPDGSVATWTRWATAQPDDAGANEDCGHLWQTGTWNDRPCGSKLPFVCEDACSGGGDLDGDGQDACGGDCDDGDPNVRLGAADACGDGVDQDCNGVIDDGPGCQATCSEAFRHGRRYLFCKDALSVQDAATACAAKGSALVSVQDAAEDAWVFAAAKAAGIGANVWMGLSDAVTEGAYTWPSGEAVTFQHFDAGQPDNCACGDPAGEDCVHWWKAGGWNDRSCKDKLPFACEDACVTADADGDGALACGSDCDDGDPAVHPGAIDGCLDGVDEDCNGAPDDGALCTVECAEVLANGTLYCPTALSYADARTACAAKGEDLLVVNDAWEDAAVFAAVGATYWIGLDDTGAEGAFSWIDGAEPGYTHFHAGEPNDWKSGEDCVHTRLEGTWNDRSCADALAFVCEPACAGAGDADGDGFDACGGDCDDSSPATHPGGEDVCGDGIDQDCSGEADDEPLGCANLCGPVTVGTGVLAYCPAPVTWPVARQVCQALGGDAIEPASAEEQSAILAATTGPTPAWLALAADPSGAFVWLDGSAPAWSTWAPSEPDGEGEGCVTLDPDGTWQTRPCGSAFAVYCRFP